MHLIHDEGLRSTRESLLKRAAELRNRARRVEKDLRREFTPLPRDAPDAAVVMENDEVLEAVHESARSELRQIERALARMEAGTYGLCQDCGRHIEAGRLRAVPYATRCQSCKSDT
jgi:RNA polymerase-binding transcription factor DksA